MKHARKNSSQHTISQASAEALLVTARLRRTKERVSVLRTLMRLHAPCTVDFLRAELLGLIHKVTLYRMLEQFADAGIVERVTHPDGVRRYEYQSEHHHHIVCTECGTRARVRVSERAMRQAVLQSACGFPVVTSHTLEFYGMCKECVP